MNGQAILMKLDELLGLTKQAFEQFAQHTEAALAADRPMVIAVDEDNIDSEKFQMDLALFRAAPTVTVPSHSEFHPLLDNGHRFLIAQDGIHLEVRRPWLHFIHRIAAQSGVQIPYGTVEPKMELSFGKLGSALAQMREFAQHAREKSPTEAAASLLWNDATSTWSIAYPEIIGTASSSHIQYKQVDVGKDESMVIDLHSHGVWPAGFSDTDNIDDAGSVKIAGVFGCLDAAAPTAVFRLCVLGLYLPIQVPADKIFG